MTDDRIMAPRREHPPERAPRAPDGVGSPEAHRAQHAGIAAALAELARDAPVEAEREIVRAVFGLLRFGNGQQHPFDATEQIACGNVQDT
jgi:hypothetical protein